MTNDNRISSWRDDRPNTPGWYWYRDNPDMMPVVVWVDPNGYATYRMTLVDTKIMAGQWQGPLEAPR